MGFNLLKDRSRELTSVFGDGFTTTRLAVVSFKREDVLEMGEGFDAPCVWQFSRGIDSIEAAATWLVRTLNDPSRAVFAIRLRHTFDLAGFFVLSRWGGAGVEVGGWLSFLLWNRGLGRELLEEITCRMAERNYSLTADVDPSNGAAIHLLQCVGYVLEDGVWVVG
jgi:RimJ/RimL family protein N-acetyltransferase